MGATAEHDSDLRYYNSGPTWRAGWAARCACGWRYGEPLRSFADAEAAYAAHVRDATRPVDTCRVVDVDGAPVRVRGRREPTPADTAAIGEVVRAARARLAREQDDA